MDRCRYRGEAVDGRKMEDQDKILHEVTQGEYKYGFYTDIETDIIEKGLNEQVVRTIWEKKQEPDFMLEFRLNAFRKWQKMEMPDWAYLKIPPIDFQAISYYAAPVKKPRYLIQIRESMAISAW